MQEPRITTCLVKSEKLHTVLMNKSMKDFHQLFLRLEEQAKITKEF